MRQLKLDSQTIAALVFAGVLLIVGVLVLGTDLPLIGTAGDTPTPEAQAPVDSDSDGVFDDADACSESGDAGFGVAANGCPIADTDNDGIGDDVDPCPDIPNDAVGDPCNPDEDGDGVIDTADACPTTGDQGNGVDGTGCPIQAVAEDPTEEPTAEPTVEATEETETPAADPEAEGTEETETPAPDVTEEATDEATTEATEETETPAADPEAEGTEETETPAPDVTEEATDEATEEPTAETTDEATEESETPAADPEAEGTEETETPAPDVTEEATDEATEEPTTEPTDEATEESETPEVAGAAGAPGQDDAWDSSSLAVRGRCDNGTIEFFVDNTGQSGEGAMDGTTPYRLYRDGELIESGDFGPIDGDQTVLFLSFTGDGATYRLEVDQRPGHPGSSNPNAVVENCGEPNEEPPVEEPAVAGLDDPIFEDPILEGEPFLEGVTATCNADGTVTTTFSNSGDAEGTYEVTFTYDNGETGLDSVLLMIGEEGTSTDATVLFGAGEVNVLLITQGIEESAQFDCTPNYAISNLSATCDAQGLNTTLQFQNTTGVPLSTTFDVTFDNGEAAQQVTLADSGVATISVGTRSGTVTVSAPDGTVLDTLAYDCSTSNVAVVGACTTTNGAGVTFTMSADGSGVAGFYSNYTVTDDAGTVLVENGSVALAANGSQQLGPYYFSTQNAERVITISYESQPGATTTYTFGPCITYGASITSIACDNTNGQPLVNVTNTSEIETDITVNFIYNSGDPYAETQTLGPNAGGTFTGNRPGAGALTLTIAGETLDPEQNFDCTTPTFTLSGECQADGSGVDFTLTASDAASGYYPTVTVVDEAGTTVYSEAVALGVNSSTTFSADFTSELGNPDRRLTVTYETSAGVTSQETVGPCNETNVEVVIEQGCGDGEMYFYIRDLSGEGNTFDWSFESTNGVITTGNVTASTNPSSLAYVGFVDQNAGTLTVSYQGVVVFSQAYECTTPTVSATSAVCVGTTGAQFVLSASNEGNAYFYVAVTVVERVNGTQTAQLYSSSRQMGAGDTWTIGDDTWEDTDFNAVLGEAAREIVLIYETDNEGNTAEAVVGPCFEYDFSLEVGCYLDAAPFVRVNNNADSFNVTYDWSITYDDDTPTETGTATTNAASRSWFYPANNTSGLFVISANDTVLASETFSCFATSVTLVEAVCNSDNSGALVTLQGGSEGSEFYSTITAVDEDGQSVLSRSYVIGANDTVIIGDDSYETLDFTSTDRDRALVISWETDLSGTTESVTVGPCQPLSVDYSLAYCSQDFGGQNRAALDFGFSGSPETGLNWTISYNDGTASDTGSATAEQISNGFLSITGTQNDQAGTITISDGETVLVSEAFDCAPPEITASAVCVDSDTVRFTLSAAESSGTYTFLSVYSTVTVNDDDSTAAELTESVILGDYSVDVDFPATATGPDRLLTMVYEVGAGVTESISAGPCLADLGAAGVCATTGSAGSVNFTITNNGDATAEGTYTVVDQDGDTYHSPTEISFSLDGEASLNISDAPFNSDASDRNLTLFVTQSGVDGIAASAAVGPCDPPVPALTIDGVCAEAGAAGVVFTVNADDTATLGGGLYGSYTIFDETNSEVGSGSLFVSNGGSASVTSPFDTDNTSENRRLYMVYADGLGNTTTSDSFGPCGEAAFSYEQVCVDGSAVVTITNTGDLDATTTLDIVFEDDSREQREVSIPAGDSVAVDVGSELGGELLNGYDESGINFSNCGPPTVAAVCDAESGFPTITVTNPRSTVLQGVTYDFTTTSGTAPADGSFGNIPAGESRSIEFTGYAVGTVSVDYDGGEPVVVSFECLGAPDITVSAVCNSDTGVVTFTVALVNGFFEGSVPYTVSTSDSGTLDFSTGSAFTIEVNAPIDGSPVRITIDEGGDFETALTREEGCAQSLNLSAYAYCSNFNEMIAYVYNSGSFATQSLDWLMTYTDGQTESGTIASIASRQSVEIDLPYRELNGTLSIVGTDISATFEDCVPPPSDVVGVCLDDNTGAAFTLTVDYQNVSFYPEWNIIDENGTVISSGFESFYADSETTYSADFTSDASNPERRLTFQLIIGNGTVYITDTVGPCQTVPEFTLDSVCDASRGVVTFTLTNTGGPMLEGLPFTDSTGGSGTTNVLDAFGGTQTFSVQAPLDGSAVSFTLDPAGEFELTETLAEGCAQALSLDINAYCADYESTVIQIFNSGNEATQALDWTINYASGADISGTVTVPAGEYAVLDTLPANGAGTFSIADTNYSFAVPACDFPALAVTGQCEGNDAISFTISNTGGDMQGYGNWTVTDPFGGTVASSTDPGYILANGESQTFTVSFVQGYVFGRFLTVSVFNDYNDERLEFVSGDCLPPQSIEIAPVCDAELGQIIFTITNEGGAMAEGLPFTVTNDGDVLLEGITNALVNNGTQQVTVTAPTDGSLVTMDVDGAGGDSIAIEGCFGPFDVALQGFCNDDGTGVFSIFNGGADMEITGEDLVYSVTNQDGVQVDEGELTLATGETEYLFYDFLTDTLTLNTSIGDISPTIFVGNCFDPGTPETPVATPTEVAEVPECGVTTEDENGFPVISMDTAGCEDTNTRPIWTPISVGQATCPDFLLYHTNQTGDFEIFRLGGERFAEADPNVSQGNANARVYDIAPSRSPDGGYAAFASIRDGNWEIYIASVGNNGPNGERYEQRVTINSVAVDIDPVWSPGGIFDAGELIVYESNRDGNFDLFMVNVTTGMETRLTNSQGNDINAAWHPDGDRILFSSDRDGLWQLYELDLRNRDADGLPATTLLSDGTANDHDGAYAPDGAQILFRSFRDGVGAIYVLDVETGELMLISDTAGAASNAVWGPGPAATVIAYQSDLDGDMDIYVYEIATGETRLVTDNDVADYAPTWRCDALNVIFSSDVDGNPNLFETPALPIDADPIVVEDDANRLTDAPDIDYYPQNTPAEENASRQDSVPGGLN